jgi:hypothetical protein
VRLSGLSALQHFVSQVRLEVEVSKVLIPRLTSVWDYTKLEDDDDDDEAETSSRP